MPKRIIQTVDRRTQKTHGALISAFIQLILTRGYEAVTIGDIIRRANVGRSTFYLHYSNKEELLKESMNFPSRGLAACLSPDLTAQQLTPLMNHFHEQRRVNKAFFEHPIRPLWVRNLATFIEPLLPRSAIVPRSLSALTIAEMQIGLITHWLTGSFPVRSEVIAAVLIAKTRAML